MKVMKRDKKSSQSSQRRQRSQSRSQQRLQQKQQGKDRSLSKSNKANNQIQQGLSRSRSRCSTKVEQRDMQDVQNSRERKKKSSRMRTPAKNSDRAIVGKSWVKRTDMEEVNIRRSVSKTKRSRRSSAQKSNKIQGWNRLYNLAMERSKRKQEIMEQKKMEDQEKGDRLMFKARNSQPRKSLSRSQNKKVSSKRKFPTTKNSKNNSTSRKQKGTSRNNSALKRNQKNFEYDHVISYQESSDSDCDKDEDGEVESLISHKNSIQNNNYRPPLAPDQLQQQIDDNNLRRNLSFGSSDQMEQEEEASDKVSYFEFKGLSNMNTESVNDKRSLGRKECGGVDSIYGSSSNQEKVRTLGGKYFESEERPAPKSPIRFVQDYHPLLTEDQDPSKRDQGDGNHFHRSRREHSSNDLDLGNHPNTERLLKQLEEIESEDSQDIITAKDRNLDDNIWQELEAQRQEVVKMLEMEEIKSNASSNANKEVDRIFQLYGSEDSIKVYFYHPYTVLTFIEWRRPNPQDDQSPQYQQQWYQPPKDPEAGSGKYLHG